jgi:serine phosphatase RsbU (regulator of sigma subunit)
MMDAERVSVLLVDDQPNNLLALQGILDGLPENMEVVKAQSGSEALRRLLDQDFAVILLDVLMPEMDGFETAALIRQRDRSRHTPIIFLTAIGNSETHISKGYSVGAVDYLFKPVVPDILRAKVATFVELFRKTEEVKRQARQLREIERRDHERRLREVEEQWQSERMRMALQIAQDIQASLYPTVASACPGFDIEGASYAAEGVGGDYFDYFPFPDGSLAVAIGDVTGHGVGPALLMAATRAYVRALALSYSDVGEILTLANRALAADIADGRFVTLLLARLQPQERSLVFASAGHPPGCVLSRQGNVKAVMESTNLPLGIVDVEQFAASERISLESGDVVLMLTDGIAEAANPGGQLFGQQRAIDVVRNNLGRPARKILKALHDDVCTYSDRSSPEDDLTAVVIKVLSSESVLENGASVRAAERVAAAGVAE